MNGDHLSGPGLVFGLLIVGVLVQAPLATTNPLWCNREVYVQILQHDRLAGRLAGAARGSAAAGGVPGAEPVHQRAAYFPNCGGGSVRVHRRTGGERGALSALAGAAAGGAAASGVSAHQPGRGGFFICTRMSGTAATTAGISAGGCWRRRGWRRHPGWISIASAAIPSCGSAIADRRPQMAEAARRPAKWRNPASLRIRNEMGVRKPGIVCRFFGTGLGN